MVIGLNHPGEVTSGDSFGPDLAGCGMRLSAIFNSFGAFVKTFARLLCCLLEFCSYCGYCTGFITLSSYAFFFNNMFDNTYFECKSSDFWCSVSEAHQSLAVLVYIWGLVMLITLSGDLNIPQSLGPLDHQVLNS